MATKTFIPSPQQTSFFSYVDDPMGGNAILEAVAGAGKTTSLIKAMERMDGRVFYGVFNKKMATEAKEKARHLRHVWIDTFHAMGMKTLRKFGGKSDKFFQDADTKKVAKIIEAWIELKGRKDLEPLAKMTADIVSMAKQRGIGICFRDTDDEWLDMIGHFGLADDLPEQFEGRMDVVVKFARLMLKLSNKNAYELGQIDFDDMIYLPLLWNIRFYAFDWVLVDEAQDTNPVRREFAKRLMARAARFIAVGDPHQAIYGFSGADNDALAQIGHEMNCKTMPLTVTYRCPKAVVKVAREFVSHITAHESAPEGFYTEQPYDTLLDQLKAGDAVICRYNKYLVNLCFRLIRNGMPARIEGRSVGAGLVSLVNKWKASSLDKIAENIVNWKNREMEKALAEKKEQKADQIEDRAETVLVLIERAQEQGITTKAGLVSMIASLFDDNVADKSGMIALMSGHKSKGLEFPRVFVLGLYELMGREMPQEWETEQEINLQYVAVTRAQEFLCNVTGVREEKKQHNFEGEA